MIRVFTSPTQSIGERGEDAAARWLKAAGYTVVERNVPGKYGEIDIVAKKGSRYHFFEVKAGRKGSSVNPGENLTQAKIRKFELSARYYAYAHHINDYTIQGILVRLGQGGGEAECEIVDLS